jgi:hypothetical protein
MEPKKDFTIKGKACQFVQNELISVDSGEPFNQFVIDILQALSGDTLTNSEIADALNSLSKGLTDGAA